MRSSHQKEVEVLLNGARTKASPASEDRLSALIREGSLDWEYVLRTARRHGVAPLLYRRLSATSHRDAVPEDALDSLRDHFRVNGLRNLSFTGELLRLLGAFEARGVPVVPYKGPALATFVYGDLALREFSDLDVLVRRRDVARAKEVLSSAGYQAHYGLTRAQEAAFLRSQCEHPFTRNDGRITVELHWGIAEKHFFPLDAEHLWGRLERIPLGGKIVSNLSPEDLLLALCVHGSRHAWERLAWVCDVAELIRVRPDAASERVIARAGASGGERMLLLGLFLASDLLGARLPEEVSQKVRGDATVEALAGRVRKRLFRETDRAAEHLEGHEGAPAFDALHLELRERLRDKVRYGLRKAVTLRGEDLAVLRLPKPLFPLYLVLRPIRLAAKYGPGALKRMPQRLRERFF